jgi:hypothetical protein
MEAWRRRREPSGAGFVGLGLVRFNNSRITRFVICPSKPAILETTEKLSIENH